MAGQGVLSDVVVLDDENFDFRLLDPRIVDKDH